MKTNYNAPKSFSDALVKFSMEIAKAKYYSRPIDARVINECVDEFTKAFAHMFSKVKTLRDELKCMEEINEYQSSLIDELITERDVMTEMYHDATASKEFPNSADVINMVNKHHDTKTCEDEARMLEPKNVVSNSQYTYNDLPECFLVD